MPRKSRVHYIAPSAISMTPNANGSFNDIAVNIARGTKIKVLAKKAGIDYENNTFQEWSFSGRNRRLEIGSSPYTIYARLNKTKKTDGYLVFAPKRALTDNEWGDKYNYVTTDGLTKIEGAVTDDTYWYIRMGDVSMPGEMEPDKRTLTFDTGILGTDEYNTDWDFNAGGPLAVNLDCTIDNVNVTSTPCVPMDKVMVLAATLINGQESDLARFDHWGITRSSGDSESDNAWSADASAGTFAKTGIIDLKHTMEADDDFNCSVSVVFEVTAWGRPSSSDAPSGEDSGSDSTEEPSAPGMQEEDSDSGSSDDTGYVPMASARVSVLTQAGNQFISRLKDDIANGIITFLKGIKIGINGLFGWDAEGNITANNVSVGGSLDVRGQSTIDNIKSHNYTGDTIADTGWSITNSYNGHSKLTIDEIYVRMKAVFESLEVRERTYTGGDQIWSCAGNYVNRTDYMTDSPKTVWVEADGTERTDEAETEEEKQAAARRAQEIMDAGGPDLYEVNVPGETVGYSVVKVPWLLKGMALVLGKNNGLVRGIFSHYKKVKIALRRSPAHGGSGSEIDEQVLATVRRVRCYFLAKDDDRQVHNWWRVNDLARCQTMNLENVVRETYLEAASAKAGNVFWWRKVIGVSTNPVQLDDGKWYHYFDVAFNSKIEESTDPSIHASMATFAMEGSDIPAAGDSAVQFGNTVMEGRMNLMMMEVNGGDEIEYPNHSDAPALKAYRGIYCFDLSKCFVGGNPCKMKLSPSTGYEFYGPHFKQVTEYATVRVPVERPEIYWTNVCRNKDAAGNWLDSWTFEEDAYSRAEVTPYSDDETTHRDYSSYVDEQGRVRAGAPVRKCYYYDKVSHNGCYFICSIVEGFHWEAEETFEFNGVTYQANRWISDGVYNVFSPEYQNKCKRVTNYTIEEPSAESRDWTMTVNRGSEPISVYQWAQEGTAITAPTITREQWAGWTDGSTPIGGWTKTTPNRPEQNPETWYLFMSQNTLHADGSIGTWGTPIRISGNKGTPGEDASDTEWIYLTNNSSVNPGAPNDIVHGTIPDPEYPSEGHEEPRMASDDKTKDDWVPNGWKDNPVGIAWDQQYEWASFRTKAKGANVDPSIQWSDFSVPIIWNHWGQNGMDGDGVEYVFMRTKTLVAPIVSYNGNISRTAHGKTYLDDEYMPVISNNDATRTDATKAWAESNECTDNAKGVSREWPYEWGLKRVMTPANPETGKRTWRCYGGTEAGQTQEMELWKHYGENAIRIDLDGEMNMVQTDSAGHVTTPRTVSVIARIYDGASPATTGVTVVSTPAQLAIAGVTPTFTPASGVAADGTLTVSWTFGTDRVLSSASDVDIILRFMNEDYRGKFTVAPSQGSPVYQLKMSQSALTCPRSVEDNTLGAPPALSLSIVRIDGANTDEMSILSSDGVMEDGDEVLKIRYDLAQMPSAATGGLAWPSANSVQVANTDNNVFVAIFNTAGRLLDRETVPVIKEGAHGDGVDNLIRKFQISASGKAGTGRKYPADIQTWLDDSPAVTEEKPYLWVQLTTDYKYKADTVEYYCAGKKGENGIDAKDAEWVYVRTQEKVAPEVPSSGSYAEVATGDHPYTEDDHKPYVRVPKAKSIKGDGDSEGTVSGDYKYVKCTDDPQGVDETWKYEWELKRTKGNPDANGHRSWNPYSGPMVLRNSIGESTFVIDIDNDNDQFGTDSDSRVLNAQSPSTNVTMMYGTQEQDFIPPTGSNNPEPRADLRYDDGTPVNDDTVAVVSVSKVSDKKYTITVSIKKTPDGTTVMPLASHSGMYVDITGTCAKGTKTIRFSLEKLMGGAPGVSPTIYQLALSQKSLSYGWHDGTLVGKSNSVAVNVKVSNGNSSEIKTLAQSGKSCTWGFDGTYDTYSVGNDGLITVGPDDVATQGGGYHTKVSILLETGDKEEIPIVMDGEKGDPGESTFVIDIDNDNDQFGTDSESRVLNAQSPSTNVTMMYGTQEQDFIPPTGSNNPEPRVNLRYDDGTPVNDDTVAEVSVSPVSSKKYTVTVNIKKTPDGTTVMPLASHSGMYVDITGTCAKGTKTIRFSLEKLMGGAPGVSPTIYQLALSQKSLSYGWSNGSLVGKSNSVTVNVKVSDGNGSEIKTIAQSGKSCTWGFDGTYNTYTVGNDGLITVNPSALTKTGGGYYSKVSVLLETGDKEEIPIVMDGEDGKSPWVADLDNQMNSVACDAEGKPVKVGGNNQSVSTNIKLFYGSTQEDFYVSGTPAARAGVTITAVPNTAATAAKTGSLTVTYEGDPSKTRATIDGKDEFTVTLTSKKDNTVTRNLTLIINGIKPGPDGKTPSIYNLLPSVSEIVAGRTGEASDIEFVPTSVATDMWDGGIGGGTGGSSGGTGEISDLDFVPVSVATNMWNNYSFNTNG